MSNFSDAGCLFIILAVGLIALLAQGILTFLGDLFTSPLLYFFIAVQVIAYLLGRWKKNRNHLG